MVARPNGRAKSTGVPWLVVAALLARSRPPARSRSRSCSAAAGSSPTHRAATTRHVRAPSPRSMRRTPRALAALGFPAVTTYGSSPAIVPVCRFFKRHGFRTVLVGVWDPTDRAEVRRAIRLRRCADGYVVGNDGLTFGRYRKDELVARDRARAKQDGTSRHDARDVEGVRRRPEPAPASATGSSRSSIPGTPGSAGRRRRAAGRSSRIATSPSSRRRAVPTVVAESGLPTEGAPATSEHYQRAFFLCIESRQLPFAYLEAFDQPWSAAIRCAPHGGLFRADGTPKLWAAQQLGPRSPSSAHGGRLRGRVQSTCRATLRDRATCRRKAGAQPAVAADRHGEWADGLPPDRRSPSSTSPRRWTPPAPVERLPQVDRDAGLRRRASCRRCDTAGAMDDLLRHALDARVGEVLPAPTPLDPPPGLSARLGRPRAPQARGPDADLLVQAPRRLQPDRARSTSAERAAGVDRRVGRQPRAGRRLRGRAASASRCRIVMPRTTPAIKVDAVRALGARRRAGRRRLRAPRPRVRAASPRDDRHDGRSRRSTTST